MQSEQNAEQDKWEQHEIDNDNAEGNVHVRDSNAFEVIVWNYRFQCPYYANLI